MYQNYFSIIIHFSDFWLMFGFGCFSTFTLMFRLVFWRLSLASPISSDSHIWTSLCWSSGYFKDISTSVSSKITFSVWMIFLYAHRCFLWLTSFFFFSNQKSGSHSKLHFFSITAHPINHQDSYILPQVCFWDLIPSLLSHSAYHLLPKLLPVSSVTCKGLKFQPHPIFCSSWLK